MKLYLVRHGDAVSEQMGPKRPLSLEGKKDVEKVAQFLKRADVIVPEIFHSQKRRAQETAEIIQKTTNPKAKLIEKSFLSPDDPTEKIAYELSQRKEDLMIVGHLPHLPRLIARLVLGDESRHIISLDTSYVAAMYRDPNGFWQIVWLVGPELIPQK